MIEVLSAVMRKSAWWMRQESDLSRARPCQGWQEGLKLGFGLQEKCLEPKGASVNCKHRTLN